jgi:hypothetical protein
MAADLEPLHRVPGRVLQPQHVDAAQRLVALEHLGDALGRVAAELGPDLPAGPVRLDAAFKAPVLLPAAVTLRHWPVAGGVGFALRDRAGGRLHVLGAFTPHA